MSKWLIRVLVLAAVVAAGWWLRATWLQPRPVTVQVVTVLPGSVEAIVTNSRAGTVKARQRARLSPEVGGSVIRLPYREGDRVASGAVILQLDDALPRARLDLAKSDLATASAQRDGACLEGRRAEREAVRIRALAADGIVSTDALDAIDTKVESTRSACTASEAAVRRARDAVALQQKEVERYELHAPFDGIVAELSIEVGEWTTPSPPAMPVPAVIDILDPASIYVSAPMDEVDSARIRPGQPVRVSIDSHRGETFEGTVERVAPYVLDVEEQNRTVEIEVTLRDREFAATLLPGTSADVEVILESRPDVLRLPMSAVQGGRQVLVWMPAGDEAGGKDTGRLEERAVTTGLRNWEWVEITSGVTAGERVVAVIDGPEIVAGVKAVAQEAHD